MRIENRVRPNRQSLKVPCPLCGAASGYRCIVLQTKHETRPMAKYPHVARIQLVAEVRGLQRKIGAKK